MEKGEGDIIKSCTIITCEPNTFIKKIHNRMPVILNDTWLTGNSLLEIHSTNPLRSLRDDLERQIDYRI
jgi:putative SOS response-associated peptidase YedK